MKIIFSSLLLTFTPLSSTAQESLKDALEAGWKGEQVCELLHEDDNIRTLKCTFPPGVGHEKHYHPAHFGYTLKGSEMRVTDKNGIRDIPLGGGTWVSDGVVWHEALNIGETTAQYIIIEKKY